MTRYGTNIKTENTTSEHQTASTSTLRHSSVHVAGSFFVHTHLCSMELIGRISSFRGAAPTRRTGEGMGFGESSQTWEII